MFKFLTLLLMITAASFQLSAQCGVYFKESNRQVFSNSFANAEFEDFDGDGLEDLFGYSPTRFTNNGFVTPGQTDFVIHYYKRLAANSFDTTAKVSTINNVRMTFAGFGDVNGDGKKDVIVTHTSGGAQSIRAYLNDGTGGFSTATPSVDVPGTEAIFGIGDLNNDGKTDVITSTVNVTTSTLYYRLAQPDNSFGAPVTIISYDSFMSSGAFANTYGISVIAYSKTMLVDDLNNDGAKDIAFVSNQGPLYVLTNNGNNTFTQTATVASFVSGKLKAYDFNNDGKKDFISNANGISAKLAVNNGNNTFTVSGLLFPGNIASNEYSGYYYTKDFSVADFDNDGDLDIIYPGTKNYAVLKNQGNGAFTPQIFKSIISLDGVANLDGDGKADSIALIRPLVDGSYTLPSGNNNTAYFFLHNAVSFRKNVCASVGQTKKIDFNGDGFADRAFFNTTNGNWRYYTAVAYGSTDQVNFQWGIAGDKPVPNDYDGDGVTDYAVFRPSNGTWWIYRSSDNQSYALSFGISEDKPVPADYDGDGKADIAVFRPSTGDWHFLMSQTGQYGAVHWGASGDQPVPADYDGDGKADVSIFRPSEGNWYRFNSSDYAYFVFHYGVSTDKPIPGDYDGDGKANLAIFRNGVWYVLRDNFTSSVFNWGTTGDEPYFDEGVESRVIVLRRTSSQFLAMNAQFSNTIGLMPSGNTTNEVLVSSILPSE